MNIDLALAGLVLVVHLLFIIWVVGGVLVVRRYRRLKWVHIGSLVYSVFIEVVPWPPCPLTLLEQMLEERAGIVAYHGSFLVYYLDALVYPNVSLTVLVTAVVLFCSANLAYYAHAWRSGKKLRQHPIQ
jgi:Protein of Unknown function (DUF2784)